jgi:hypothetical protein
LALPFAAGGLDVLGLDGGTDVVGSGAELLEETTGGVLAGVEPMVGEPASWSAPPHEDISAASAPATTMGAQVAVRRSTPLTLPHRVRD